MLCKNNFFIVLVYICVILASCKKNDQSIYSAPSSFTVSILERDINYALISWTKAKAFEGGQITYKITINGQIITSALTDTTYRITGITGDNSYQGTVIAKDDKGNTSVATFTIGEAQGYIFFTRWDDQQYHCYTIAGDPKWQINEELSATPAASHDTIFARGYTKICALNARTGTIFWKNVTSGIDQVLYSQGQLYSTVSNNQIIALEAKTGKQMWVYQGNYPYNITLSNGILLAEYSNGLGGEVIAIDAKTGDRKWRMTTPAAAGPPLGKNGLVFLQYDAADNQTSQTQSFLAAYDLQTGALRWRTNYSGKLTAGIGARPVLIGNKVYFVGYQDSYSNANTLYAITADNGNLSWQVQIGGGAEGYTIGGHETDVYVTNNSNTIIYNAETGKSQGVIGNLPGNLAITNRNYISELGYSSSVFRDYFAIYDLKLNVTSSRLQKIQPMGSFLVMSNDGKFYYPITSTMYSVN